MLPPRPLSWPVSSSAPPPTCIARASPLSAHPARPAAQPPTAARGVPSLNMPLTRPSVLRKRVRRLSSEDLTGTPLCRASAPVRLRARVRMARALRVTDVAAIPRGHQVGHHRPHHRPPAVHRPLRRWRSRPRPSCSVTFALGVLRKPFGGPRRHQDGRELPRRTIAPPTPSRAVQGLLPASDRILRGAAGWQMGSALASTVAVRRSPSISN